MSRPASYMFPVALLTCIAVVLSGCGTETRRAPAAYTPVEGDVVFQSLPPGELVDMIEGTTESPYSHCGLVAKQGNSWQVIEAIGEVRETPLDEWIERGRDGQFWVYRPAARYGTVIPAFVSTARAYLGRPYDYHYAMDDGAIYCSELVYKAFRTVTGEEMGTQVRLGDLKWQPFEGTIRMMEGGELPLDRMMITPRDLARAPQLAAVPLK